MKAIILTCDKYRALTEHMIFQYNKLWPNHPFVFRIPYQELPPFESPGREYIQTPAPIKSTVLKLLEDLDDEEWVYWCIDDRYPVTFDLPQVKALTKWVPSITTTEISGILYCRCRTLRRKKSLTGNKIIDDDGRIYLERKDYGIFWLHQFFRVKVIRYLFEHFPNEVPSAKKLDELKSQVCLPKSHRLFVTQKNLAIFGESSSRGILTQNCYESMIENNLPLPEWFSTTNGERIIMGHLPSEIKQICRNWMKLIYSRFE